MNKKRAASVALAGVLTALAVVFLLVGSLFELLDLSMAAVASLAIMVALIELDWKWALGVYAAASAISLLILPNAAGVVFAGFLGYYPVLIVLLDRIRNRILQYGVKILLFGLFLGVTYLLLWLLAGPENEWISMAKWLIPISVLTFLVFDFCLSRLAVFYVRRIRKHLPGGRWRSDSH